MIKSLDIEGSGSALQEINEQELRRGILSGDKKAIHYFFDQYITRLYKFVFRRVNSDSHKAEDITQEACLKALESLANFRGTSSLYTYICTIAINLIRASHNMAKRDQDKLSNYPWILADVDSGKIEEDENLENVIRQAVSALPVNYQQVIDAKYTLDMSHREISEEMGITEKAVESLLYRAREALRNELENFSR